MSKGNNTDPQFGREEKKEGDKPGAGSGLECVCPVCGTKSSHQTGVPCFKSACPKCGAWMVRY